jgi:activator of 2-hydroxyglutaryl-CoA dehydratase
MAKISLQSTRAIPMNAQCAVFGESEVVSLIHQKTPKQDIARAVHDAIASRIGSVARIVGLEDDVVIIGGMAKNTGFVESLKRDTGAAIKVIDDPDYVGALGAAFTAATGGTGDKVQARVIEKNTIEEGKA